MTRDLIIQTATSLFTRYGIKQVSMDSIAGQLHISKKTIYEHFSRKDELLKACMQELANRNLEFIQEIIRIQPSVLSAIIQVNSILLKQALAFCPAFIRDMKEYDDILPSVSNSFRKLVEQEQCALFQRGIEAGVFIDESDCVLITKLFDAQIDRVYCNPQESIEQRIKIYTSTIFILLAGFCSERGRKELSTISIKQYYI